MRNTVHPLRVAPPLRAPLALWAGLEAEQIGPSGHDAQPGDLDRLAQLGVRTMRYPIPWERIAPRGLAHAAWGWADQRLARLRAHGVRPIVVLSSGDRMPAAAELAAFAGALAARHPWLDAYTPVHEPRGRVEACRATGLAMRAVRAVNPDAQLVQTEDVSGDLGERRWLGFDLLAGLVDRDHPLHASLVEQGVREAELDELVARPCGPDVLGLDLEPGEVRTIALEAWRRYRLPVAITRVRWSLEVWDEAQAARERGADVVAVTVEASFGRADRRPVTLVSAAARTTGYADIAPSTTMVDPLM